MKKYIFIITALVFLFGATNGVFAKGQTASAHNHNDSSECTQK